MVSAILSVSVGCRVRCLVGVSRSGVADNLTVVVFTMIRQEDQKSI